MENNTLYQDILSLNIEHDSHCSDLYIPCTKQTLELLKRHNIKHYEFFKDNISGNKWIDVFFAYEPHYNRG